MLSLAYNVTVLLLNGKLYDVLKSYFQRPDYLRLWFLPLSIFISENQAHFLNQEFYQSLFTQLNKAMYCSYLNTFLINDEPQTFLLKKIKTMTIRKQRKMQFFKLIALLFLSCYQLSVNAQAKKPNIVVIMGDDIGWLNMGCYNQGLMATERQTWIK